MHFLCSIYHELTPSTCFVSGPGSSVGITTEPRAGQSGDRIPVGGEIFRTRPDRPWGPPSLLYNGYRVFHGGKTAGEWFWPPTPFWRRREWVELYLYSPSRPLVACYRVTLPIGSNISLHNVTCYMYTAFRESWLRQFKDCGIIISQINLESAKYKMMSLLLVWV
jgi:hypothetical protein